MSKKQTKLGSDLVNEETELELVAKDKSLIDNELNQIADKIMDMYEDVFEKLSK